MIECLKAWGKFPRKLDATADGLRDRFKNQRVSTPQCGALVFWLNPEGKAVHVEICINSWQSIGASGGGSNTKTMSDAIRDNAFIKIRPIQSGLRSLAYVDPFKGV